MITKLQIFISVLIFAAVLSSCSEEKHDNVKVDVKKIDDAGLQSKIQNRNGNILFINVWATWCDPCVAEFPDIVKIAKEYTNKGVDFLSLSADFESKIDSSVIPFLISQKAEFPVFVMQERKTEQIINLLNKEWSGALPVTIIYDSAGKQRLFVLGAQNYDFFKNKIDSIKAL